MGEEDEKTEELSRLSRDIPNLIRDIEKIKSRREGIIDATKARFNVFTILLQAHDEVRLHTRFITSMLDGSKDASHGCGTLFLKLFLEILDNKPPIKNSTKDVNVELISPFISLLEDDKEFESIHKEYHTGDKGNIDILIKVKNAAIAIENKIYAGEQEKQLSGYSEYLKRTKKSAKYLFFLTLQGHDAVSNSDEPCFKISYREHIIPWLDLCLEKTYSYQNINSVIGQYKKVVQQLLSNNPFEEEDMKEIKELIGKNPGIVKYIGEISVCVEKLKWECEERFIKILEQANFGLKSVPRDEAKDDCINYSVDLNNSFFTENKLTPTLQIQHIFSNECILSFGIVTDNPQEKVSNQVNGVLEKIERLLSENHNLFHKDENCWWPAGYICFGKDKDIFQLNWLSDSNLLENSAKECSKEINDCIEIIKKCLPE